MNKHLMVFLLVLVAGFVQASDNNQNGQQRPPIGLSFRDMLALRAQQQRNEEREANQPGTPRPTPEAMSALAELRAEAQRGPIRDPQGAPRINHQPPVQAPVLNDVPNVARRLDFGFDPLSESSAGGAASSGRRPR